jgi:hypothetical protein
MSMYHSLYVQGQKDPSVPTFCDFIPRIVQFKHTLIIS